MTKRNKIIYWVATVWLALGMVSTGIVQLMGMEEEVAMMDHLGYPIYFLTIIGIWKLLGVVAVLIPKFPLLKEWAYAGFVFTMTGAIASHLAVGDAAVDLFGPTLLLALSIISWYFRPPSRKTITTQNA
ncbi:DoxX family protein [Flagellimonas amoyensis]|uniref:DoxX family protein n=1 Tax=Flagellimonas amoyensis TaxID=2169401 RepID=UPI000D381555|nr:DoxX family protein [Allomuricauda amoyensis]